MSKKAQRILLSDLLENPPSNEVLAGLIPDPAHAGQPYIRKELLQALNLRCKGYSISEVAQRLSVSNGRISAWTLSALRSLRQWVPTNLEIDVLAVRRWLGLSVSVASKYGKMSVLLDANPTDEELREEFVALGFVDGLTLHSYPSNRDLCIVRARAAGKTHVQIGEEFGTTAKMVRTKLVRAYWYFQRDLRLEMDIPDIFPQQRTEGNNECALPAGEVNAENKKPKENYCYEQDYASEEHTAGEEESVRLVEDLKRAGIFTKYGDFFRRMPHKVNPYKKIAFEKLVNMCDQLAIQARGHIKAVIDYTNYDATIVVSGLRFLEFRTPSDMQFLTALARLADNITFTQASDGMQLQVFVMYFDALITDEEKEKEIQTLLEESGEGYGERLAECVKLCKSQGPE